MNVRAKCVNPECSMVGVEKSAGLAILVMRSQVAAAGGLGTRIAFSTPVSDDTEYARMLILAALNRTTLWHY